MHVGKFERGEQLPRIGLLCEPGCNFLLLADGLERAGRWKCDATRFGSEPPREPPAWDALLMDASSGLSPRQAVAYFGISAPVIAIVRNSAEMLERSDDLDGANAFVEGNPSAAHVLLTVRTAMSAHGEAHRIRAGLVQVDLLQNALHVGEVSVSLTAGEARVIGCLARTAGRWRSSKELLRELGTVHETSSPVWQHVARVRSKLGPLKPIIESTQALGYRVNPCAVHETQRYERAASSRTDVAVAGDPRSAINAARTTSSAAGQNSGFGSSPKTTHALTPANTN
jgi:DNA-binding winged helix-turn-helix (wHTH) protein